MKIFHRLAAASAAIFFSFMALAQGPGGFMIRGEGGQAGWQRQGPPGVVQFNQNQSRGFIFGSVFLSPDEEDGVEVAGVGVTVTVIPMKEEAEGKMKALDTLYTTVNDRGFFNFRSVPVGKAYVRFSMVGYEEEAKVININPGENKLLANLKPQHEALDAAVLKEKVSPISVKGDTIIFNAAAVRTNKGEMAIDILEQMPGVSVSESSVSVLNEEVKSVYVDGALLFGKAPMKALNNIPAEEVTTIKSYQEYSNKDPFHKISKNEDKERVLDIQTRSKSKFVVGLDLRAGGGFDTDSTYHKGRYTVGVQTLASSEKLTAYINANLNNINSADVRLRGNSFFIPYGGGSADLRCAKFDIGATRRWMSPTTRNFELGSLSASYSFTDKYDITESITERIYFPTDQYESRRTESTSKTETGDKQHIIRLGAKKSLRDGSLSLDGSFSADDNNSLSYSSSYNYQDALERQGTSSSNDRSSNGRSYSLSFSANKGFADKLRLSGSAGITGGPTDGMTTRIDTTTSTITRTVLEISDDRTKRSANASARIAYELSERSTIYADYTFSDSYSQKLQRAFDVTDPAMQLVDTVNTQLRTDSGMRHTARTGFRTAFAGDNVMFDASLGFTSYGLTRLDEFPTAGDGYSQHFNSLVPSVVISNKSQIDHWAFEYHASDNTPSVEQVRARIDNSNLYSVSAGNPLLKQSTTHNLRYTFSTVLGREARETMQEMEDARNGRGRMRQRGMGSDITTLGFSAEAYYTKDVIASKRIYYSQETFLPDYGYTMPAQSTFSTYANAGNRYGGTVSASFTTPVKWLGSNFTSYANMQWNNSPSYVDARLIRTNEIRPSISLGLRTTFSRNVRLNFTGSGSYVLSTTDAGGRTEYFTESLKGGFEVNNILKKMYVGGSYTKAFTQGIARANINDNILDIRGGVKFGPRNAYDISLVVHDLFNKTTGFSTSTESDFITNTWRHQFGRYIMLNFAYRFNSFGRNGGRGGAGAPMGSGGPGGMGGGRF